MDFALTGEQLEMKRQFYEACIELEKLKPEGFAGLESWYGSDEYFGYHRHCAKEFAKRGWLSLNWPPEYGGTGTIIDVALFAEARGYHDIPGVDPFGVRMLAPTLLAFGSDELKRKLLPAIASAEATWCQLWSEPDAGSDLASLTATAVRKGDELIVNGQKTWTTGGHKADWGFGVFKTDLGAPKHRNLSFLVVDMKTPGITVEPILFMDGAHLYNAVYFDDVHVPAKNILGRENEGWKVFNLTAGFERSGGGEIMRMQCMLHDLVAYCNETRRDGKSLACDPLIRNRLSQVACEVEAARTLCLSVVDLQSRNEMSLMDAAGIKVFSSEVGQRLASLATDILGPFGQVKFSKWSPLSGVWEKEYQNFMRVIAGGANEVQKNIIALYGLGLPKAK